MKSNGRMGAIALLMLAPVVTAWSLPTNRLVLQPESRLWVEGTSSVRSYSCTAKQVDAQVVSTEPGAAAAVLAGQKAVTTVAVTIPSRQLDCANGTMNEHMLKALKASDHPEISFRLASYDLSGSGDATRVTLTGTLTLGGAQKQITVAASARDGGPGAIRVTGAHELLMSEYGLKAPSLMLGTMKVHDRVKVNFDLYLKG